MIDALQRKYPAEDIDIAIYSGEKVPDQDILKRAESRFNIKFQYAPRFIQLSSTKWIHPSSYPVFTIVGQIIGTMKLAIEAVQLYQPDVFIDSMGLAFAFWIVKCVLPNCQVMAYVHYPFVSVDMLRDVYKREASLNNSRRVADSAILSGGKYIYYKILIYLYGKMGQCCDYAWTNSTWTTNQMKMVWPTYNTVDNEIVKLFPPCQVTPFLAMKLNKKENIIMSFAQFRPEKQHKMQLDIFKQVLEKNPDTDLKFHIVGSCRGPEDDVFLDDLKKYVSSLGLNDRITFWVNLPFEELMKKFEVCSIGIHTMNAEHFGIAIVEMMAAGLVTIAHNSAGPKFDIIQENNVDPVGFLAENVNDYVNAILLCLDKDKQRYKEGIVARARSKVVKFSDEAFKEYFVKQFTEFMDRVKGSGKVKTS